MRGWLRRLWILSLGFGVLQGHAEEYLSWDRLPDLPPGPDQETQVGVAGPFVGIHNDVLLVAGGANFPEGLPWQGGKKVWQDQIFVLSRTGREDFHWQCEKEWKLPRPLAYGVGISTAKGVLCVGGCDADRCYEDCFYMSWDSERERILMEEAPSLPLPLASMAGALTGGTLIVAGGQETMMNAESTRHVFALDLSEKGEPKGSWRRLPSWPGPPRILPVSVAQSDGKATRFYLFSGRDILPGRPTQLLTDAYTLDPVRETWITCPGIGWNEGEGRQERCVMAGTGIAAGGHHILLFGGAQGDLYMELEDLDRRISEEQDPEDRTVLTRRKLEILESHPGFSRDILSFNTITHAWSHAGTLPVSSQVTTTAVDWKGHIVLPSGETRPGIRTPHMWRATPQPPKPFGTLNGGILLGYLISLVTVGIYFSRREKGTDDFFRAGRRIPWWAAGLSIFGTQLSAITFMAIPAKTYATDWRYFMLNMCIPLTAPIIILLFLPFYRNLDVTTAYEYLERRFNLAARLMGSLMFMILQLGRIGIILFLPSIALSMVVGMDVRTCILIMGVLSILYTVMGGIEAVIWTDVMQVAVLLGGALLSLILILTRVEGGLPGVWSTGLDLGKLQVLDPRFLFSEPTLWVVLLGGIAANLISYGSDQSVIQRYLTTRNQKEAAKGIWTNALITIPATVLFFFLGTALFVYFQQNPSRLHPILPQIDAIFPWYIVSQLPAGVAGLLIAGIFAASMSSLDSSMNSVAATLTTDWYQRCFVPNSGDKKRLLFARFSTAVVGALGVAFALIMTEWEILSLWDQFSKVIGLFAGGLAGLFLLGMLSKRAHGLGGLIGLVASGMVQYTVKEMSQAHLMLYTFTGLASCFLIGWLASLVLPGTPHILGLTRSTMREKPEGTKAPICK